MAMFCLECERKIVTEEMRFESGLCRACNSALTGKEMRNAREAVIREYSRDELPALKAVKVRLDEGEICHYTTLATLKEVIDAGALQFTLSGSNSLVYNAGASWRDVHYNDSENSDSENNDDEAAAIKQIAEGELLLTDKRILMSAFPRRILDTPLRAFALDDIASFDAYYNAIEIVTAGHRYLFTFDNSDTVEIVALILDRRDRRKRRKRLGRREVKNNA